MAMLDCGADICGFLVVRCPEHNFDADGRGIFPKTPPKLGETLYGGIFRMPWFDIEEDYYAGRLAGSVSTLWDDVRSAAQDFSGFEICQSLSTAERLLEYSNRETMRNELIAVRSAVLANLKGRADVGRCEFNWMGNDIVAIGHWSLLKEGLFVAPSYFQRWTEFLNEDGLLDSSVSAEEYYVDYCRAAERNAVEELPPRVYGIDAVSVGRLIS